MGFKSAKLLIATIGLCLGSAAIAEDLVNYSIGPNGTDFYYDAETIRRYSNNTVEVWSKQDASKDKTVTYRTKRSKLRIDCSAETFELIALFTYRADGTVIDSGVVEYPETIPIPPASTIDQLSKILCPR